MLSMVYITDLKKIFILFLFFMPFVAFGATDAEVDFVGNLVLFLLRAVPFVFGLVLIFILWSAVGPFLQSDAENRKKGEWISSVIWGTITLGVIIFLWWLLNFIHNLF